ncbi:molybdopterin-binding oxidoreductase [Pseudonocardia ailaonensis]|uniref:Molybdopterin-binding oxidoreductase n=1 Tax=Pseudonocardia ailaonensis TaxID=367279 RepID=A0ABN2N5C8_9PSEU
MPAGAIAVTGAVRTPRTVTADQIAALPQRTVSVQFASGKGTEQHAEAGVLLTDLLPVDSLATTSAKNDQLSFAVVAVGSDGYRALVSYGEAAPDFGNRGLLVSTSEDGAPLARPRLVVPGDGKGGRYVSDLVRLEVIRAAG